MAGDFDDYEEAVTLCEQISFSWVHDRDEMVSDYYNSHSNWYIPMGNKK